MTEQDYDAITTLNQRAAFFVAQAVARRMVQASVRGSIIHISSQMGHVGGARRTVYCMSKHGIEGLTKAMAIDLAPHGIRVNTHRADLHRHAADPPVLERQARSTTTWCGGSSSAGWARWRT